MNKASVYYNGTVIWEPPAIYKSMCPIEIEFFPFDIQQCEMRFGKKIICKLVYDAIDFRTKLLLYSWQLIIHKHNSDAIFRSITDFL